MVLFPRSGFGRFLLGLIVLSTISYLVLNIVSFAGTSWITYTDAPIRFGLWRVCDTSTSGLCNQWADDTYSSNITTFVLGTSKPSFIRTSQALEIISLIFYVIAAVLIIIGIINLAGLFITMFAAAAGLLLICITFLSATLGVMSVQGRSGRVGAFLDWAWWNGLVGLIMTIVCFFSLIFYILDMTMSSRNQQSSPKSKNNQQNVWGNSPIGPYGMAPQAQGPTLGISQLVYPTYNQPDSYHQPQYQPQYDYNNYPYDQHQHQYYQQQQQQQQQQYYPDNSMMSYGNQSLSEQYYHNQTPSPLITALAREYVSNVTDAQYGNHLLDPYRNYNQDPYIINNYL